MWQNALKQFHGNTDSDSRFTPEWVLDRVVQAMGGIDLDPCADPRKRVPAKHHLTEQDDGLAHPWGGSVFMNPPFSDTSTWVKHLCIYIAAGSVDQAVVLVPEGSISNKGFRLFMAEASAWSLITDPLNFLDLNYEPIGVLTSFTCAAVYYGNSPTRFLDAFEDVGIGSLLYKKDPQRKVKLCAQCGKSFKIQRSTAKFCSTSCRVAWNRTNAGGAS